MLLSWTIFFWLKKLFNVKTILNSWAIQNQVSGRIWLKPGLDKSNKEDGTVWVAEKRVNKEVTCKWMRNLGSSRKTKTHKQNQPQTNYIGMSALMRETTLFIYCSIIGVFWMFHFLNIHGSPFSFFLSYLQLKTINYLFSKSNNLAFINWNNTFKMISDSHWPPRILKIWVSWLFMEK